MTLILKWLMAPFGKYILAGAGLAFLAVGAVAIERHVELLHLQVSHERLRTEYATHLTADALAETKRSEAARKLEHERAQQSADSEAQRLKERSRAKAERDALDECYRSGKCRLRNPAVVSCRAASPAGTDGTITGGGVQEGDAILSAASIQRVLRVGDEADDEVINFRACMRQLYLDRGLKPPGQ